MSSFKIMFYRPYEMLLVPVGNSVLEILHLIGDNFRLLSRYLSVMILSFVLASSLGYYTLAIRSLTWVLLGVASSIGFGFGMHTFVLFLAPHIAAVTMAAHSCRSLDFPEPPYPNEIVCPDHADLEEVTFFRILRKVGLESFMWGLGTAIGELPPYLAARLRAQAIGRRAGGDNHDPNDEAAGWEIWMIKIINKVGFIGILLCAAIPNPLFDAAGVASGMAQIPFLSFFGATMIGKAVIKVLLQTSFVILSFHKNNLESLIMQLNKKLNELFPSMKDLNLDKSLTVILKEQRDNVLKKRLGEPKQTSLLGNLFNWIIFACFALFIMSLINALDKQYRERKTKKARRDD
jgi:hypothetical protein